MRNIAAPAVSLAVWLLSSVPLRTTPSLPPAPAAVRPALHEPLVDSMEAQPLVAEGPWFWRKFDHPQHSSGMVPSVLLFPPPRPSDRRLGPRWCDEHLAATSGHLFQSCQQRLCPAPLPNPSPPSKGPGRSSGRCRCKATSSFSLCDHQGFTVLPMPCEPGGSDRERSMAEEKRGNA